MIRSTAILALIISSFGLSERADAQTASDFFHSGAQSFVASELPAALNFVESGLELEPADSKLLALKEKIEEQLENQDQQGNNNEQSSENQDQQDQENQEEQESEQQQEQSEEEQESSDEQQDQQDGEQSEEEKENENESSPNEERPPDPDQLSKEQAERILQALENEEEKLLREVQKIKGRPRRVEKDW